MTMTAEQRAQIQEKADAARRWHDFNLYAEAAALYLRHEQGLLVPLDFVRRALAQIRWDAMWDEPVATAKVDMDHRQDLTLCGKVDKVEA